MSTSLGKGTKSVPAAVAPTTSATLLLAANQSRISALIFNNAAATLYIGKDATVTTVNGIPVAAGAPFTDTDSFDAWYGIMGSITGDVRVVEVSS